METPENNTNPKNSDPKNTPSLLDQIIKTSNNTSIWWELDNVTIKTGDTSQLDTTMSWDSIPPSKKPRDPMTAGMVIKIIASLLLVAVIFFGSFLAYIAFNPEQAGFFVKIFRINPNDIQDLLKNLINGSFGIIVLILSIVWIVSLFKAIWTPKIEKRRRLMSWLSASIFGILLFSVLAFWAYLFKIIRDTPYSNLGGAVIVYDNKIYPYDEFKDYAQVKSTNAIIGPITLKYNLETNAKAIMKKNFLNIDAFEIDFDGAKCINGKSTITGTNPTQDEGIICTFDEVRTYNIKGTYTTRDRLNQIQKIDIPISPIEIKWLVEISENKNSDGKQIQSINASSIKNLGTPRWIHADWWKEDTNSTLTEKITKTPTLVCFKLFNNNCDRYFVIVGETGANEIEWSIQFEQDSANPLGITMSLSWLNISTNEIIDINWVENERDQICQWPKIKCKNIFTSFWQKNIVATILLANKVSYKIKGETTLNPPLKMTRHALIKDQDNNILNPIETFDSSINAYVIKNLTAPMNLIFDARDILIENPGYRLTNVIWKISNTTTTEEKKWETIKYELLKTERYKIEAIYTFEKENPTFESKIRTVKDVIILDLEHKEIEPILQIIKQTSDYVPSKITVDASSSNSKNWKIQKFTFDFGEGRIPTTWDAIQTYEYTTPGEKKITLTVTDSNNQQTSISKYIILKDTPKSVAFSTSMSPGVIDTPITFIADGSNGQIEDYIWNFWDNTPVSKWYEISHSFSKKWNYNTTLTVRYTDGTEKSDTQIIKVEETLE